jgi:Ulp1 protease family, C-terminal catalytic domain
MAPLRDPRGWLHSDAMESYLWRLSTLSDTVVTLSSTVWDYFCSLAPQRHPRRLPDRLFVQERPASRVLIPINVDNSHWILGFIDVPSRTFGYYCSFHRQYPHVGERLGCYVHGAWTLHNYRTNVFDACTWRYRTANPRPRQTNVWDCGVFTLAAAAYLMVHADVDLSDATVSFNQANMPAWRAQIADDVRDTLPGIHFDLPNALDQI